MSMKIITTEQFVERSGELFNLRGYFNTSVSELASHAGLKKASVYHHVPSKKELGIRALKLFHTDVNEKVFSVAFQEGGDASKRLSRFIEAIVDYYSQSRGGCLVGNFSLEASGLDEDFRMLCQDYFSDFKKAFLNVLPRTKEAELLADDAIALVQGYIMAAQVRGDSSYVKSVASRLKQLLS